MLYMLDGRKQLADLWIGKTNRQKVTTDINLLTMPDTA
ncbi:hypothetical protein SAMN05421804_11415 [Proteiniclasticum ruminis]|uniref:Uncharacterized protein n=1 Tax=Proteiniclasticum ruminis TaxID=398199 RepID=A0A1G8SW20_9CLOT|nr:hypothetical protein SAMN05421804_11415 [Proteiniclasticum ruminis]